MTCFVSNINNLEIERKFLVANSRYKELAVSHALIRQGYLCANSVFSPSLTGKDGVAFPTVRVRQYGDKAFLTIKGRPRPGEIGRLEWEREISLQDFETLFPLAVSGAVEKTRWLVPLADGLVCEVDEFHGLNAGLVLAEVELRSEDEQFEHPDFLGVEVTHDARYYNSYLSSHPFITW